MSFTKSSSSLDLDPSSSSSTRHSTASLPMSPYRTSPWTSHSDLFPSGTGLVASLVREDGHIYSLAASRGLLYAGSDSKNIRVFRNLSPFSGFKSSSGLVKSIVLLPPLLFSGHQDGKIRIWKHHSRHGTLPRLKDFLKSAIRRKRVRHSDAVSCLAIDEANGLLYSGSWDRTVKVWRVADSRLMDTVCAHDDVINSIAVGLDGIVFTGSADGTVKVWGRRGRRLVEEGVLVKGETAVTALGVSGGVLYGGFSDGRLGVWIGREVGGELRGHREAVLCVGVGGEMVFTGSADKAICVWGREEGGRRHVWLSVLTGHEGPVKCLAVEEDGERGEGGRRWVVYSGSMDRSVKVWKVTDFVGRGGEDERVLSCGSVDDPVFDAF